MTSKYQKVLFNKEKLLKMRSIFGAFVPLIIAMISSLIWGYETWISAMIIGFGFGATVTLFISYLLDG